MFKSLPVSFKKSVFALSTLLVLLCSGIAYAQTPQFYTPSVSSYNNYPFNGTTGGGSMCQFMYMPSNFQATPAAQLITVIYFKTATTGSYAYTNMLIKMGNTSLTGLTSGTWNGGLTTVYTQSSVTWTWTTGTWYAITLQTPFLYTGGNMIVEASQAGTPGSGGMGVWYFGASATQRMYGITGAASSQGADVNPLSFGFDGAPPNCSGTPLTPTITTPAFTAAAPLCAGSTTTLTATDPNLPVLGMAYQWQIGSTATGPWSNVINGSGATTLVYTTGPVPTNTYYRIGAICTNSNITSYSSAFLVPTGAPQPSVITGNSLYCPGDPSTYAVTNVPGTTYSWTLPAGWSGFSTTNSILVTPGTNAGTISVIANSSCGTSIARSSVLSLGSAPGVPGTMTGNTFVCSGSTQVYSVPAVPGAMYYTWTLPSGWAGSSTTNSITATPGNTSGNVTVSAINGCGPSSSPRTLAVTIITSLANPGVIAGLDTVCSGTLQSYSIAPVPGATSYTWSFPNGWSGTTTGTAIQAFPGTVSGNVQVTASATCAYSPISFKPVYSITTLTPTVSISSPASILCQGTPIAFTAAVTNAGTSPSYQWKKNGLNVLGTGITYTDNLLVTGDVIQAILTSSVRCKSAPTAASNTITANVTPAVTPGISINTTPMISICQGTPMSFVTTSTGTGTLPGYQWYKNNIPIAGATSTTYTDAGLLNKDTLTIRLTSNAVCATSTNVSSNKVGITVTDMVIPTISITASASQVTLGDYVTFTATSSNGGSTPTYQWQKNGVDVPYEINDTYVSNTISPGDHVSVKMLSYALCASPRLVGSNEVVMKSSLGLAGVAGWEGTLSLYPNPTGGRFTIAGVFGAAHVGKRLSIDVLNTIGQSVYHSELVPDKTSWQYDVQVSEAVSNGGYILRLSGDGMRATMPFVLNR